MAEKQKILVCGDVKGKFKTLFNRVESINKKSGPFEFLLCVGDFFGAKNDELEAYKNNCRNIPVPTYILGPNTESATRFYDDVDDGEICSNLTYLGKRGLYTSASGIKIAYLSGSESNVASEWTFSKDDVCAVRNSCIASKMSMGDFRGIDILLTSQWPEGILDDQKGSASKQIAWLVSEIRPRYHFCGINNTFNEREPFRTGGNNVTQLELATRFISLASVGNEAKERYIYAASLMPVDKMRVIDLVQRTTNETPSPFATMQFEETNIKEKDVNSSQFFYDMKSFGDDDAYGKHRKEGLGYQKKRPRLAFDQEKCWFCLSSANVEKHLVVSIGEYFYLAMPKGPINATHVLILSVTHIQSSNLLAEDDWNELVQYKKALQKFFESQSKVVTFFERNYRCSHLQINAIGVPADREWQLKPTFEEKGDEYQLQMETLPALNAPSDLPEKGPYFIAELPNGTTLLTRQMKHFPIHYGREVFCSENLLDCEDKVDWKDCGLDKEEEIQIAKDFKLAFRKFDFTL